jgi:hypothetical protein
VRLLSFVRGFFVCVDAGSDSKGGFVAVAD